MIKLETRLTTSMFIIIMYFNINVAFQFKSYE